MAERVGHWWSQAIYFAAPTIEWAWEKVRRTTRWRSRLRKTVRAKARPYGKTVRALEVAKFCQMLLNGGVAARTRILKPETVAEMTRPQTGVLKAGFLPGSAWGLGFCLVEQPERVTAMLSPGSFGHGGAHGTQSWADSRRGLIYIMMIQRAGLPNSDGSEMRRVFQETASAVVGR